MTSSPTGSSIEGTAHSALSRHYLLSPLETLDESLTHSYGESIELHDLAETYNLLATRIKEVLLEGSKTDQAAPLTLLAERSQILANALRRDVMRVMINPCTVSAKAKERSEGMNVDEIHYARDLALLGQQAIRLISELFAFPQLYSTMTVDQLRLLLRDVLVVLSEPSLPTPHSKRTFALLRWVLQAQKLPVSVLSPHNSSIIACVKRSLEGEKEQVNVDGLNILAELLRSNTKLFLGPACDLLCYALKFLISESADLRFAAAYALSAFAYAKVLQALPYSPRQKVSYELSRTIRKYSIRYLAGEDPSQKPFLHNLLQSSLKNSQLSPRSNGPQWTAVVIASFIVLMDTPLFESAALPKMKDLLWQISDHSSATVRLLHTPIWNSFVWAFARIPPDEEISRKVQTVISQDLRNGTGALLSHVMLNLNAKDMVARILEVINCMFTDKPSRQDGVILLCQLLRSSTMPRSDTDVVPILHQQLFDGKILNVHLADLMKHTSTINRSTVVREIVRELSVQETIDHWDRLHELWADSVKIVLKHSTPDIQKFVLSAWQTLLRADTEFCRRKTQVAPSPKVAHILSCLCDEFASKISDVSLELKQIRFLCMLWHVAQRLFSHSSLKDTTDKLLTAIVRRDFPISHMTVQAEWLKLCATIALCPTTSESRGPVFHSQTWMAVARIWTGVDNTSEDSLVAFLKLVFPERLTADEALQLWGKLLRKVLTGFKTRIRAPELCSALWKSFATDAQSLTVAFPKQFHALISAFVIPFNAELSEPLLPYLDNLLCSLYSLDHPFSISMQYIDTIREMLLSVSDNHLVSCISSLCCSLRCFMEDRSSIIPNNLYFQSIFPLYEDILQRIRHEEPNEKTIGLLWKLFLSPVERPVPSKNAIKAFEAFWLATYHGQDVLFEPELIRYLKGLDMALGVGLAAGLTQSDDTQQKTGSFVPETQSLKPVPLTGSQILERYIDNFGQDNSTNNPEIVPPSSSPMREPEPEPTPSPDASGQNNLIPILVDNQEHQHRSNFASPQSKRKRRQEVEEIVEETPAASSSLRNSQNREGIDPDTDKLRNRSSHQQADITPKSTLKDKGKGKALPNSQEQAQTHTKRSRKAIGVDASKSWMQESQLMTPEPSAPPSSHHGHVAVSVSPQQEGEEDYGSWENAIVSPGTFAQISRELDVNMDPSMVGREGRFNAHDRDHPILDSPSVRAAKRRKLIPITGGIISTSSSDRKRARTTSAKILQLQHALQAFKDDAETPIEDLVKASELVQEFGSKVNKKLLARTKSLALEEI
ncbi:hypothetical protein J3R30DRAFT_3455546 [Lentinula aciculospora]|uniref:Telomere-associated protein Rif1 N-terminal domain-containing protein n=1 Tax=Lentinula aciculospora TaxID=153920 RepID=A0A9W9AGI7_9AGAR|nr:hypothetical protein J3R30DRAFT_3455546 [Lentinula aciculospora]